MISPSRASQHALAPLGEAGGLQAQGGHDGEGVVHLEKVDVLRADAGLLVGLEGGCLDGGEPERVAAGRGRPRRRWPWTRRGCARRPRCGTRCAMRGGAQHDGGRAIADARGVEQVDRIGDHARLGELLGGDRAGEHGIGVADGVAVGVDGKAGKVLVLDAVLVHVAPHEQGVDGDKGEAVDRLRSRRRRPSPGRWSSRRVTVSVIFSTPQTMTRSCSPPATAP